MYQLRDKMNPPKFVLSLTSSGRGSVSLLLFILTCIWNCLQFRTTIDLHPKNKTVIMPTLLQDIGISQSNKGGLKTER